MVRSPWQKDTELLHGEVKRETNIICNPKEDQLEFLEERRFKESVNIHSEWIGFPIVLYVGKSKEKEATVWGRGGKERWGRQGGRTSKREPINANIHMRTSRSDHPNAKIQMRTSKCKHPTATSKRKHPSANKQMRTQKCENPNLNIKMRTSKCEHFNI